MGRVEGGRGYDYIAAACEIDVGADHRELDDGLRNQDVLINERRIRVKAGAQQFGTYRSSEDSCDQGKKGEGEHWEELMREEEKVAMRA